MYVQPEIGGTHSWQKVVQKRVPPSPSGYFFTFPKHIKFLTTSKCFRNYFLGRYKKIPRCRKYQLGFFWGEAINLLESLENGGMGIIAKALTNQFTLFALLVI